jgi:phosphatidate cytidylyltransferase
MKTRIITAIIGLPFLILPLYYGGISLYIVLLLASLLGLFEFFRANNINNKFLAIAYIFTIIYYLCLWHNKMEYLIIILSIYLLSVLITYVFSYPTININTVAFAVIGFIYVVFLLSHVVLVRDNSQYGSWFAWLIFIIAYGSDTMAYFTGRLIGKNKLAEKLSPKKTIEGAIGGVCGAIILSCVYGFVMYNHGVIDNINKLGYFAIMGCVGSILSQIGDLSASAIKRDTNIKDFGKIMPGHGGVLDRIDSILFTGPFIYYIMTFL